MARIPRKDILDRLHGMIDRGEPIIGGGAGTGLSAKCEEAGGIDLIVIYNSGRYRMAGRGSLAGLLAYGNANDVVLEMAREVLPVVKKTPVLAGVNGTDPFLILDDFLHRLGELGFSGVQNFPTVGIIDGLFRQNLEETGMGYGHEVEMIRAAHEHDLLTTPYVFNEREAIADGRGRRRHHRLPHGPDDRRQHRRRDRAEARRLRAAHQGLVGGGAPRSMQGHHRAVPRRADRHARGCRRSSWRSAPNAMASTEPRAWSACRPSRRSSKPHVNSRRSEDRREDPMSGAQFGTFILGLVVVAIVVAIVVWLFNWLYLRSSKERAFVRTGPGRAEGGDERRRLRAAHRARGHPGQHEHAQRLEVARGRDKALITRDRMRVDVLSEFYVRVQASDDAIAAAAQTLGQRTMQPDALRELIEGKFVDALRTVAAEMTMEEMHEKRGEYVRRVRTVVAADLLQNGLELETVSLTQLDQTAMEYFNPSNAFDAEGLTRLTEQIERRKKIRNDIEQDTMIEIRNKNLDTERQALEIDRALEHARLAQEQDLETQRAAQRAEIARERADKDQDAERAQITVAPVDRAGAHRLGAGGRGAAHRQGARGRGARRSGAARRSSSPSRSGRSPSPSSRGPSRSAQAEADKARALAVTAEEQVFTARETEMAQRRKSVELIVAQQEAERDALRLTVAAGAEKAAAADRGAAVRAEAEAEADADKIRSLATRIRLEVDAEGTRLMNEAQNLLSADARLSAMRHEARSTSSRPSSANRSSRWSASRASRSSMSTGWAAAAAAAAGSTAATSAAAWPTASSIRRLRFRAQAPLIDQLPREIGVQGGDVGRVAQGLLDRTQGSSGPPVPARTPGSSPRQKGGRGSGPWSEVTV